jgi:hypothetical protein
VVGSYTKYGHIDLSNGAPVQAAGEFKVVGGEIRSINNASGHYKPAGPEAQAAAENAFRTAGVKIAPNAYKEGTKL